MFYKMFCSRLLTVLCEWIALVFLCHVVGHTLCFGVTPLGLERMLALFGQSYSKGGLDLGFPQSSAAVTCYDRAVSLCDRAVSQCDRAVSQCDRAVSQCDRAVSQCDRAMSQFDRAVSTGRGFIGSFHVNLCRDERDLEIGLM